MAGYLLYLLQISPSNMMPINKLYFISFFLLVFSWGNAQTDLPTENPLSIKAQENDTKSKGPILNIPSVINKPQINIKDSLGRRPVKMLPDRKLVQAGYGLKIDPKIGVKEKEGSKNHFGDQYLGDVKNNGEFIGIVCRDHEFVDGDRVKIWVNDVVADPNILLTASFKGVNVDLKKGFNRIDFEALNHGSSAPNTAQINVYDDKGELIYSNKWLLSAGSKATLIITKE
ncbi:hypothetical protein [Maribacter sp.]|uniref:hypothetical protein n=1 Tax=Maribacter sp. TaxID=1897614 RepID=UPI0025BD3CFF|nr:hypothetical protein [Maribacter sp.]